MLKRKRGESIVVGNLGSESVITIMEIDGGSVKLGIDAPKEISVDRSEIRERKLADPDYEK